MLAMLSTALISLALQAATPYSSEQIVVIANRSPDSAASVTFTTGEATAQPSDRQRITVVRIKLKRNGDFKNCAIATSSGSPALDTNSCMLAKRAYALPPVGDSPDGKILVRPRYEGPQEFLQTVIFRVEG